MSDAAEQLLAWLRAAGELVRGGMFSERYALDSGLPRADVAGILDLALSEREILQFYQTVSYEKCPRPLRTIALHYPRFHNGGVERVMAEQMPVLQSLGLRVVLLLDAYEAEKSYECPPDVPIVVLGNKDDGWLSWYRRFQAACEEYDVDGVYCHRYLADAALLPWLVRSEGRHFFAELHSIFIWWVQLRYELLRLLCQQAENVAVLSRVDARFWQLQGVSSFFLPNPVAVTEWELPHGEERKDVYWIGRLEQISKKVYDVVPIMQRILARRGEIRLHLVGTTDHPAVLSELKRRIDEAGIASAIVFEGYHQDLCDIYRRARVCLMTSRFEGFPMVLTEALSHGVPVVMYDLPYLELVRQCQGIFSVPMGDTAAAAEAVSALLSDDALWQRSSTMAVDSLRAFVQRYPQKHLLRKFLFQDGELAGDADDEETLRILVDALVDWQVHPCGG
ncbi:glycosyltransferase family 4 protein [uncultured Selenomonas sp.]|uniref:glycosyltransferase family 4 protein n=1 Tax=uncultured Selenomonas sp. TaxID=159275 RepID=UPI0025862D03|nr:glycosyltransferase family 4 protein [uncultured Selenomonas sp.]